MASDTPFQVIWLPDSKTSLRALAERALQAQLHPAFTRAVTELNERLERDPEQVGELIRRQGPVVEHSAGNDFVVINFAIDLSKKVVAVRRCTAAGRSGL